MGATEDPDEITSIEITKGTRKRLRVWKAERGYTYDEAINHLLDSRRWEPKNDEDGNGEA